MDLKNLGPVFIVVGMVLVAGGILLSLGWAPPGSLRPGKLPGDFTFRRGNGSVTLLLGTSLVLSVLVTLILAILRR